MEIHSLPAEPVARCKVCGNTAIVGVCHHCSSALCQGHATNGAPGSREFRGLGVRKKGRGEDPIHCADCSHRMVSDGEIAVLAGLGLLLALLALASSRSPLMLTLVGAFVLLVAGALVYVFRQQRRNA